MSGFESIGQILPRVTKKGKAADELLALQIRRNFPQALSLVFPVKKLPKIAAGKFSYGTLTVLIPDPAWSTLIRQKELSILKKLNSLLGQKIVDKLRFKIVVR